jgi:hypothetical protein
VAWVCTGALCIATRGLFAAAHPATSEENCSTWLELAGERPLRHCGLRASGRASKIHCQMSHIQATLASHQQNSWAVFCRTVKSVEPVCHPLSALTKYQL